MTAAPRLSPIWIVPIEAARALAPESTIERLRWLEMEGVTFRQSAMMMVAGRGFVTEILFDRPCAVGNVSLRFQTGVPVRENG